MTYSSRTFLISCGLGSLSRARSARLELLADDVIAQFDAFVTDEHRGPGNELAHLVLALPAERAVQTVCRHVTAAGIFSSLALVLHLRAGQNPKDRGKFPYSTHLRPQAKQWRHASTVMCCCSQYWCEKSLIRLEPAARPFLQNLSIKP